MKIALPTVLSFTAGYVDTAGYLALQGLFTAHVTGNFVTIAAALAFGTSGVVTKLSALPVFCAVVMLTRLVSYRLPGGERGVLPAVLSLKLILLVIGAALAICWGPFANGDSWMAWVTGMVLVAAMAVQNAAQRIHLGATPPSTIMTGNTTQIMIDLADWIHGLPADRRARTLTRLQQMSKAVASFAIGAAMAALLFGTVRMWCFAVAPAAAVLARLAANSMPRTGSSGHDGARPVSAG
jgi:uncharacterized membrane protein YoaK (UPF0700 family)